MSKKTETLFVVIQDLVLAFVINSAATILGGGFETPGLYLIGMFEAFSINYIAGLILPVPKIGTRVADWLGISSVRFLHKFVRIFISNAIYVTIISFCIALINCGPVPGIIKIWFSTYPMLHLVGLLTSLLTENSCMALADILSNHWN